jgi:WD40 repeat protein
MFDSPLEAPRWARSVEAWPTAISWSQDGSVLAVGTEEGRVHLLGRAAGDAVKVAALHGEPILALAWNPRHGLLATAAEGGAIALWEPTTDKRWALQESGAWAGALAWSPDGESLAVSAGKQASLYSRKGQRQAALPEAASTITGLGWGQGGKLLGCACYGGVQLYFARTGKPAGQLSWQGSMLNLHWSPDGKVIACGCQDKSVHFWRLQTGQDSMMSGYPGKPTSLSWSHDSRHLATNGGAEVAIWDFSPPGPEKKPPILLEGHTEPVAAVAWAPNVKLLATGCKGGLVGVWAPERQPSPICHFPTSAGVEALAWARGERPRDLWLATAAQDGQITGWPLASP